MSKILKEMHFVSNGEDDGEQTPLIIPVTLDDPESFENIAELESEYPNINLDDIVTDYEVNKGIAQADEMESDNETTSALHFLKSRLERRLGEVCEARIHAQN